MSIQPCVARKNPNAKQNPFLFAAQDQTENTQTLKVQNPQSKRKAKGTSQGWGTLARPSLWWRLW